MFRGITAINIDGKGRLAIPTRYRDALSEHGRASMVVTIDTEEKCLLLYPTASWQVIEDSLQKLPSFNPSARRIQRLLIGHATDVEMDGNGRVLLPSVLRDYAALDKKIVLIGQGNKFEVWNEEAWQDKRSKWLEEEATRASDIPEVMQNLSL